MKSTVPGLSHAARGLPGMRRAGHASPQQACRAATPGRVWHTRHRPEETLLYKIVDRHYPAFLAHLQAQGRTLPHHVKKEFEAYLKCGRLENGFLRFRCDSCHTDRLVALSCKRRGFCPSCGARRMVDSAALLVDEVLPRQPLRQWVLSLPVALRYLCATDARTMGALLGIAQRAISTFLIKQAKRNAATADSGAVTLIQRFGGALNLNIHFHMLFLDGVYMRDRAPGFQRVSPPTPHQLQALLARIARRMGRWLEKRGLLQLDSEDSQLLAPTEGDESVLADLQAHSLTYRIALGPHRGGKAFTLQTLSPTERVDAALLARAGGFSLHAGLTIEADQREKLEHLCRYIARPPLALERLSLTPSGTIRYRLKNPWKNGTTELLFEPLDFLARLASLVPARGAHLTRYHGLFAPHSALRAKVTPAGRGSRPTDSDPASCGEKHRPMSWAQRLKRTFGIDVSVCAHCGGSMRWISCIEEPALVERILAHLQACAHAAVRRHEPAHRPQGPPARPAR